MVCNGYNPRKYNASAIAELAGRGHGAAQIADFLGIHHVATVRQIARREGIEIARLKPTIRTIREQIQDMSEREAREHLLFVLEEMLGNENEIADLMKRFQIKPSTAKVYAALRRASPRSLSKDQLGVAMAHKAGQLSSGSSVAVAINKLRRALPENESIINVWGIGYRWEMSTTSLSVTSRVIIGPLPEQLRPLALPVLERVDG